MPVSPRPTLAAAVLAVASSVALATFGAPMTPRAAAQERPAAESPVDLARRLVAAARTSPVLAPALAERHWIVSSKRGGFLVTVSVEAEDRGEFIVWSRWYLPNDDGLMTHAHACTVDAAGIRHVTYRAFVGSEDAGGFEAHRDGGVLYTLGAERDDLTAGGDLLPAPFVAFVLPSLLERPDGRATLPLRVLEAEDGLEQDKGLTLEASSTEDRLLRVRLLKGASEQERAKVLVDALVETEGERRGTFVALVLGDAVCRQVSDADARAWIADRRTAKRQGR